jgi:Acetyltransferases
MIKALNQEELKQALPLVWTVFCEYEAVNYSESNKQAFWDAIHSEDYLSTLSAYGAFEDNELVGIIATRNEGSHIALFFVDRKFQGRGIGRKLWHEIINHSSAKEITVHSSIYAKDIYAKLGFMQVGPLQNDGGIQYFPMVYKNLIWKLQDKDDKKAYELAKQIGAISAASDEYYSCFEDFLGMIIASSSYIRTRGFSLCCAQARWDTDGKLKNALPSMLILLHDPKPTVVRQCLGSLHEVMLYLPELCKIIEAEIQTIDLSNYKDSMVPLIQKDIDELKKLID